MANPVFRISYEVVGEGLAKAAAHREAVKTARNAGWELAQRFGAVGFRPSHGGGVLSLFFDGKEPPEGFKYRGREAGKVECTPHKGTKRGKEALAAINAVPRAPSDSDLAAALGYRPASAPMDGFKIYWPTAYDFTPSGGTVFLSIPRQADDGWEPDASVLVERPESTFMLAMETHNAAVRAERAKEAALSNQEAVGVGS
jgi:hypothetical protein